MNDTSTPQVEQYLDQLRKRLRGMRAGDVDDILAELRAHIAEKTSAGASVQSTLSALGTPEQLASEYVTDGLLARAELSRSPFRILNSLFHIATFSATGFAALLATVTGYTLGVIFVLGAFAKILHPHTAGLWRIPDGYGVEYSLRMGFANYPGPGREVLGWWIVPLGLVLGYGLIILTTRVAVWGVRKYRASRPAPGAAR
jgi:HAAS domain-containing protein